MPFESKAQMRYMFATNPAMAKEFAEKTAGIKKLPDRAPNGKYQKRKPVMPKVEPIKS